MDIRGAGCERAVWGEVDQDGISGEVIDEFAESVTNIIFVILIGRRFHRDGAPLIPVSDLPLRTLEAVESYGRKAFFWETVAEKL